MSSNIALIDAQSYPKLAQVSDPFHLRALQMDDLPGLAGEIRRFLLEVIPVSGGHLSANLGVVELTIALHYVFQTPQDCLIWDVGHQAYVHKLLTHRAQRLHTVRQLNGISPFPRYGESVYDVFSVGHASTALSAAIGMSVAIRQKGEQHRVIAVVGDGSLTGGMIWEALNHAATLGIDLLLIANCNGFSIEKNVGALHRYGLRYLRSFSHQRQLAEVLECLNITILPPIAGHDLPELVVALKKERASKGIRCLPVITQKGKGYSPAERDPARYHALSAFMKRNEILCSPLDAKQVTYSTVFGTWLCRRAALDPLLCGVTPAMALGSGMRKFMQIYPDRGFDVGIAEPHALTFSAGLAAQGLRPVVAIYASFLQRALDQWIHDLALDQWSVLLAVDRAGVVPGDGETHQGCFDISFLRATPGAVILAPSDQIELAWMLDYGYALRGVAVVRYPKAVSPILKRPRPPIQKGHGVIVLQGRKIAFLCFGSLLEYVLTVGKGLHATVVDMRFLKPIDKALITNLASTHVGIVTVEEHTVLGGAGAEVAQYLAHQGWEGKLLTLGLPDRFLPSGTRDELMQLCRLDIPGLMEQIKSWLAIHGLG